MFIKILGGRNLTLDNDCFQYQVLREKNWKAMEALSKAEKQAESAAAKDAQIETLSQQLQEARKAGVSL